MENDLPSSIEDDDSNNTDLTEDFKYLRYMERMGLAESYLAENGKVFWELTELGCDLQSQNQLPNEFFYDVLH